tara:strand:- start:8 stop:352 length:345 start_codon:yes stop_codon:yes gene_type:complete
MYKNDKVDILNKATYQEEKLLDTIDTNFYNYLYEINKLFKQKKYKSKIGSKTSPESVNQTLIYFNPINGTERFTIQIHNKYSIYLTIPLKNSNFLYSTFFFDIEDTFNFLKIHI